MVDATGEAPTVLHALLPQPLHDVQAADAVMAEDYQRPGGGLLPKRVQMFRNGLHRNQFGGFEMRDPVFERFANVDEGKRFAGVEAVFDFLCGNFHRLQL